MLVGFVGWRGMVGSVLINRMFAEKDFDFFDARFFSTSNVGGKTPERLSFIGNKSLHDAYCLDSLSDCDVLLSCQGAEYTKHIYPKLRNSGWNGYFIDASKALRMEKDSVIALDPINDELIRYSLNNGIKNFCGGNCTVSCLLMAVGSLFKKDLVEWLFSSTYQAASGAGANHIRELLLQMGTLNDCSKTLLNDPARGILEIDKKVLDTQKSISTQQKKFFGVPIAGSLIPWIDKDLKDGTSLEEWKGFVETNKILGLVDEKKLVPIEYNCVRVGSFRCHSQSLMIKLRENIALNDINQIIANGNEWVKVIPNDKKNSENFLSPLEVSGTLSIHIGRIRKLAIGPEFISAFTTGDQLLWGAAEPLRRMLKILVEGKLGA